MKSKKPTKNLPELPTGTGIWGIVRMFLSGVRLIHKGLGAPRVIAAYLFFTFAMVSLLFTVSVPLLSDSMPTTTGAKAQSRVLTAFMMIMNLGVYGMIMSWHRSGKGLAIIRIAVIVLLLYTDVNVLGRVIYTLIRDHSLVSSKI